MTPHARKALPAVRWLTVLAALGLLAACASPTPDYDRRFGESVRHNRQAQVADPQAGARDDAMAGLDGSGAREAMQRYRDSFKQPPPVVNVINIGGGVGTR